MRWAVTFNDNWLFTLTEQISGHLITLDESDFKSVTLPHDFSIEQPYNKEVGDGCTGYLVGGIGWYRKHFTATDEMHSGNVFLCFDGIYNRSDIYVNEHFVAFHPYGYSPLTLDITEYLRNGDNVIAVKVDRSRYADSRWYAGSGIYRDVKLYALPKTYIPPNGVRVLTEENKNVYLTVEILNADIAKRDASLLIEVVDPTGRVVFEDDALLLDLDEQRIHTEFTLENPILWDIHKGDLYTLTYRLVEGEKVTMSSVTKFGVRDFHFDSDKGFYLNGENRLIKGVCLHHDAGLVGVAVPKGVWKRRLLKLIEGGCNAIRTAHNPASREFIELCDELGLLVQEEFYDEWDNPKDKRYNMADKKVDYITRGHSEFFKDYAKQDLQAVLLRDINSPSIFQWSIGNEIEWTYPKYNYATGYFSANADGNYFWDPPPFTKEQIRENVQKLPREKYEIGETAKKLASWVKELDGSRPVIANLILPSASYESGYADALDMVGYSYRQVMYEYGHTNYPDKPIVGTENLAQYHEWKQVLEKEYISGLFLWTGIDYIGESGNVDVWPQKANRSGLLDVAGFDKPSYHMFRALWCEEPVIYIATQTLVKSLYELKDDELVEKQGNDWRRRLWFWHDMQKHWNYSEGESVVIEVYSNSEAVTLYLNDNEISTKYLKDFEDRIYRWVLPFNRGEITAKGKGCEAQIATAGEPKGVSIDCEEHDGIKQYTAQLTDGNENPIYHTERKIEFVIEGEGRYYGIDNGSASFVGDHSLKSILTENGRAMMIVGGDTTVTAHII